MADQTESTIIIDADAEQIMAVIADLETYPEWAGVKACTVLEAFPDGRPKDVEMTIEAGPIRDSYTITYQWTGHEEVSWRLTQSSVLRDLDGTYLVHDLGNGTCEVTYRLLVDLTIPMIGLIKRKAERTIVDTALRGLKKRVEE